MDIGFDTIIYIILGLIFVLAQVARKKKRDASRQVSGGEDAEPDETRPSTTFLEQLLGIPEEKPPVRKPVESLEEPREHPDSVFLKPDPLAHAGNYLSESTGMKKIRAKPVSKTNAKRRAGKKSGFDLRSAVIYKAVLDRKKF